MCDSRIDAKKKEENPVAEDWLADALTEATAAGRCDLEPFSKHLRELAPLRQSLSDKVHSALVTPFDAFVADADKVAQEKKKYESARDKLESAREVRHCCRAARERRARERPEPATGEVGASKFGVPTDSDSIPCAAALHSPEKVR